MEQDVLYPLQPYYYHDETTTTNKMARLNFTLHCLIYKPHLQLFLSIRHSLNEIWDCYSLTFLSTRSLSIQYWFCPVRDSMEMERQTFHDHNYIATTYVLIVHHNMQVSIIISLTNNIIHP